MKKIFTLLLTLLGVVTVYALNNNFSIDSSQLSFSINNKNSEIASNFSDYQLTSSVEGIDDDLESTISELTKKIAYLLLGEDNESNADYYKRYQEYLALRYDPEVPKDDSTFTGLDEDSEEYLDDLLSGYTLPNFFYLIDELGIKYDYFGNVRVSIADDMVISAIAVPNITLKEENPDNPMEYIETNTNLVFYLYFKELDGEYKLYYLYSETDVDISDYLTEVENLEDEMTMAIAPMYSSQLQNIYSYAKIEALSDTDLEQIYQKNQNNVVTLASYYNNSIVSTANGFYINDGLVVTTWSFLEKALLNAQYMAINSSDGEYLEMDGIVTINIDSDIAVIKLKEQTGNKVSLGAFADINIEDAAIIISSKNTVGMTLQSGIIVSTSGYIQTSIPLQESEEGSPLIDSNGNVIGMNTNKSVNASVSMAINSDILSEVQNMFDKVNFDNINTISFTELKEKYYYLDYSDEVVLSDISESVWNNISSIGNLEETITLELVKASYQDNIVSLRYKNKISNYIDNMQFAVDFKNELINQGYTEELSSITKSIYKNNKYQIIIMSEFDYLIVVVVKL